MDYMDANNEIESTNVNFLADGVGYAYGRKIINGSKMTIGRDSGYVTVYVVDQHFNWFQKLMWKWAFGIKVEDYSEE